MEEKKRGQVKSEEFEQLVAFFDQFLSLSIEEKNELKGRLTRRSFKRRQFLLQEGEICKHYFFVIKGCCKMYGVDSGGKEHNLQFAAENTWISNLGSFHSETESQLYIEAMEPMVVLQLAKPDLLYFYTDHPNFNRNFRVVVENEYIELQNRVLQNISYTAEQRYLQFLERYSSLLNRLPNTQIASYLGITPEFLSKIRKDLAS